MKKGSKHTEASKLKISISKKGERDYEHSVATRAKIGRKQQKPIQAIRIEGNKKIKFKSVQNLCRYFGISHNQFRAKMKKDRIISGYQIEYLSKKNETHIFTPRKSR